MLLCKFSIDNNVIVEFDPLGFSVKTLDMGITFFAITVRVIYPFTLTSGTPSTTSSPNMALCIVSTTV